MDFLKFLKKLVIAAGFFLAAIFYVRGEQSNTGDNTAILLENPAADGGADADSTDGSARAGEAGSGKQAAHAQTADSADTGGNVHFASADAAELARELAPLLPRCSCAAANSSGFSGEAGQENASVPEGEQAAAVLHGQAGTETQGGTAAPGASARPENSVQPEAAGQPPANAQPGGAFEPASSLINLNTASREELMQLPGIGEAKADAIIRYRTEYGAFAHIEEVMNISGIKEAAFEKIKDSITV